jgi:hypothetical protein
MKKNDSHYENITCSMFMEHDGYEVLNQHGENVGINILLLYYGRLWELAIDRIDHKMDGYMFEIQHMGEHYKIYRKIEPKKEKNILKLRVVK